MSPEKANFDKSFFSTRLQNKGFKPLRKKDLVKVGFLKVNFENRSR